MINLAGKEDCDEQIARLRRLWEKRMAVLIWRLMYRWECWDRERAGALYQPYWDLCIRRCKIAESRLARVRSMRPPGVVGSGE